MWRFDIIFQLFIRHFFLTRPPDKNYFSYFSTKTYVVVFKRIQKHRFKLMDKKIIAVLRYKLLLNWTNVSHINVNLVLFGKKRYMQGVSASDIFDLLTV